MLYPTKSPANNKTNSTKDEILEKIEPLWDVKEVVVEFTE